MPRSVDEDDDPEAPDPSDIDDGDGDVLDPCPKCGKLMYDDSEQCPHCGHYADPDDERTTPPWTIVTAAVILIGGVVLYLVR